ncbi:MAG TPA: helix-turn-helix transcriptional regulator [Archangium sp.]|nr:helix-turn-helix transcriptional regulator [Archangium sp.]
MSVAPRKEAEAMEMKEQAEKFRRQVLERGEVGPRTRYTQEQRQEAVAYMQARQQQGTSREEAAKELGVSSWTLSCWDSEVCRATQEEPARATLVPTRTPRRWTWWSGASCYAATSARSTAAAVAGAWRRPWALPSFSLAGATPWTSPWKWPFDHLPLERQVRAMEREALVVDSQTLLGPDRGAGMAAFARA